MAPLRSIPTSARPMTTTDGANAGAKSPLRAKASQIKQARPTDRIVPNTVRTLESRIISPSYAPTTAPPPFPHRDGGEDKQDRGRVEMRVSQGPRKEPSGAYMV